MPVFDDYSDNIFTIRCFGKRGVTVGILPCIMRQRIKEWEGGMQDFQIAAAHGKTTSTSFKKLNACFEDNLPSEECDQTRESSKGVVGKTIA